MHCMAQPSHHFVIHCCHRGLLENLCTISQGLKQVVVDGWCGHQAKLLNCAELCSTMSQQETFPLRGKHSRSAGNIPAQRFKHSGNSIRFFHPAEWKQTEGILTPVDKSGKLLCIRAVCSEIVEPHKCWEMFLSLFYIKRRLKFQLP